MLTLQQCRQPQPCQAQASLQHATLPGVLLHCIPSMTVQGIGLSWEQTEQKRLKALGIFSWSITASDEDARMHTATQAHDVGSRQEAVPNGFWNPR